MKYCYKEPAMRSHVTIIFLIFLTLLSGIAIISCKKETKNPPVLTTKEVWSISQRSARTGGEVLSDGGSPIVSRGVCWSKQVNPTVNDFRTIESGDLGSFISQITVNPGTRYYVRAYAINAGGTGYGNQVTFETNPILKPSLNTVQISSVNLTSAESGGLITDDGGGMITEKGVCWSTFSSPTVESPHSSEGTGYDLYVSQLTGLLSNTIYYVRAYATNEAGTSYGEELTFRTLSESEAEELYQIKFNPDLEYGTVRDVGWNTYKTIQIGTQIWMAENLKTTSYNNLAQIPHVEDSIFWVNTTDDAFCWYRNDIASKTLYGALYNWKAVTNGNLCPVGWHIPTQEEWLILENYLGGEDVAGGRMKETGTWRWMSPNSGASNESGFTALPGGSRSVSGSFLEIRFRGTWWSSTPASADSAFSVSLTFDSSRLWEGYSGNVGINSKDNGLSVRCIQDH